MRYLPMDTAELQTKLTQLTQLLPSQRECLDRLLFQLAFNQHKSIRIVGSPGSGKSVMALAMAELFSDKFNVALLDNKIQPADVGTQLMKQWFNRAVQTEVSLAEQLESAVSVLPLLVIIDDVERLSDNQLQQLQAVDCLLLCFASEEGENDDITLLLSKVTAEDASQLLQQQKLNTLEIAQRLAQADGNMHLLLQAAENSVATEPEAQALARKGYAPWLYAVAALLLVSLLWWLNAGDETKPVQAAKSKTQAVSVKTAETPQPKADLSAEPELQATAAEPANVITDANLSETTVAETEAEPQSELEPLEADTSELSSATGTEADTDVTAGQELSEAEVDVVADAVKPAPGEAATENLYSESELLAMDKQSYALQLAVLSSAAAYQRFQQAYPELPVLAYSRSWQGQAQIVLLLASFSDKATAKAQLATLPAAITATGPFIKPMQAVQTEIKVRQSVNSASAPD
ncbi:hypothetical protein MN202_06380 [Rheinheimera muenzenbergensis]|uniref:SPOR domain-containing protein n=1 Tax=Rheinheimera muenzenbergensis TaxID=1193628 RepID=A0ABU8C4K1_9GAMM